MSSKQKIAASLIALALLAVMPLFLTGYPLHLVNLSGIWIVLALSLGLIQGYIGEISLGHAAFFGLGAYTSSLLTMEAGVNFWLALPAAGLATMILGYAIGLVSLRLRGPYFAICTLAFGEIIRLIFVNWRELTQGQEGITGIPSPSPIPLPGGGAISFDSKAGGFYLIYALVLFAILVIYRIVNSRTGKAIVAIREDEDYAECLGINAMRYKRMVFCVSTFLAGLAGSVFAHYLHYISPYSFTVGQSFDLVIMVIVGGMGTIIGPIIGAVVLTLIPELLHAIKDYRLLLYGLMLMLVIIFSPEGIAGLLRDAKERWLVRG
ncbi:MAG: branched-chain amino acid ABC transporter permease [Deltaproteobacteria bacterium]|nr:branched-chain amino acid ABC transporter permease [Deltaproteobacteria bacterium]